MTNNELLELLASWENLDLIKNEAISHPENMKLLVNIALYSDHPKRWRAAWVAGKINDTAPKLIVPYLKELISALYTETSPGIRRHLLKLISRHEIPENNQSFLLNYSYQCFTSANEPVAIRVHAMQILYNLSEKEPDFKPELLSIIQHETEVHPSPGILSRGKKLRFLLQKQIMKQE